MTIGCPFPAGTHVAVERWAYDHHGVVLPDGKVVEYGDDVIRVVPYSTFAGSDEPFVVNDAPAFPVETVLHRAMFLVGERKYRLLLNNCEHFATWCVSGKAFSDQVFSPPTLLGRIAAGVLWPFWALTNIALNIGSEPWDQPQPCTHCGHEHGWSAEGEVVLVPPTGSDRELLRRELDVLRRMENTPHSVMPRKVVVGFRLLLPRLWAHMDALDASGPRHLANDFAEAVQDAERAGVDLIYEPEPEDSRGFERQRRKFNDALENLIKELRRDAK